MALSQEQASAGPISLKPFSEAGTVGVATRLRRWSPERPLAAVVDASGGLGWVRSVLAEAGTPSDGRSIETPARDGVWLAALPYDAGALVDDAFPKPASPCDVLWTPMLSEAVVSGDGVEANPGGHDSLVRPRACPSDYRVVLDGLGGRRAAYEAAVARGVEYIRAGDVFQVNLAHAITGRFTGSARGLFADLLEHAGPRYAAYVERPGLAVLSLSPELFLALERSAERGGGLVRTRPMKGTRPRSGDPGELESSGKDRAELAMIVDLMRNDLGRVAAFGSVRVATPRAIESHGSPGGGVYQATATVEAALRAGVSMTDLLRATLPPGSVTGAPKIRATEIIAELEPGLGLENRGYFTGAMGLVEPAAKRLSLNVAIRTITITGEPGDRPGTFRDAGLILPVGAGIVADSRPGAEFVETLDKARFLTTLPGVEAVGHRGVVSAGDGR